jgi:hypothetical protein
MCSTDLERKGITLVEEEIALLARRHRQAEVDMLVLAEVRVE